MRFLTLLLPFLFLAPPASVPPPPSAPPAIVAPRAEDAPDGDYGDYLTYTEMEAKIAGWCRDYPGLVQLTSLGTTREGREIPLLRLSAQPETASLPEVMLLCGIHPREQQPQIAVARLTDEILKGYGSDPRFTALLQKRVVWIVPVFNVDGKVYDMRHGNGKTRGADWRKNREPNADGTLGVDLNRNFGIRWGGGRAYDPEWRTTTTNTSGDIYEGPSPMSEPETQALARFFASRRGRLRAFLDLHSPLYEINLPGYVVGAEYDRYRALVDGMRAGQKQPYPASLMHRDAEPPAEVRGGNSGLTYTWAYYTEGLFALNLEFAPPKGAARGVAARYAPPNEIVDEYERNIHEPLLRFLEAGSALPAAQPGSATASGPGTLSGKLVPGSTVTWTPPAITGRCEWAVLVSGGRDAVVPSEFRLHPARNGFVLQAPADAKKGAVVPLTLYVWDADRHVSALPFKVTVE